MFLVSARGTTPPPGYERDFPQLLLEPLPLADAGRLLDSQPTPPRGRARDQVLTQAAGNPLALIELSRMVAADPGAGRRLATELLPLTSQLTAVMAARYTALPERAKAGLLLAAAADSGDVTAHAGGLTMETLAHAEAAGLIGSTPAARSSPIRSRDRRSTTAPRSPTVPRTPEDRGRRPRQA